MELKNMFIVVTTLLAVGLSSVLFSESIHAKEREQSEVSSERSSIKEDISKAEAEITDVLVELQEINNEINEIDNTLKANEVSKVAIEEEITDTEEDIEEIEEEIEVLEDGIEARFEILKQRASSYQKSGGEIGYLDVIVGVKDFSELISRLSAVSKIKSSDAELINQQEADKKSVETQRQTVNDKLSELQATKKELESIETLVIEQKAEIESKEAALKDKEKELNQVISEMKIKDESLAILQEKVKSSFSITGNDSNITVSGNGQLSWPTSGGYISSHLGQRNGRMHKGIDIARTDRSTSPPILSADSGVVESAGSSGGYGNKVVIDHGNGIKTLYAHLSTISVSAGQSVSKGDKLGVMGTTGNSTGIHLHFEVYVDGVLQNPTKYLN